MGDFSAPPVSSQRSMIHLSTRIFSPKPGQRNWPFTPLRNQFTLKMSGGFVRRFPMSSQCWEIVADVVATEWQHRHWIAAHSSDSAGGGCSCFRSHGRAEVNTVGPIERLIDKRHGVAAATA